MATEASNKYDPVDKVSSLQYVLYNTPYGSLSTMIADLKSIKEFQVKDDPYQQAIRDNQELHCEIYLTSDNLKCVCFDKSSGKNDTGFYYDNHYTKQRFYVANQEITGHEPIPDNEMTQNDIVDKLGKALEVYLKEFFGELTDFCVVTDQDKKVQFCYTSKVNSPLKYYNGYWLGKWTLSGANLSGRVETRAHNFESGNVHFHEYKDFDITVSNTSTPNDTCKSVIDSILLGEKKLGKRLAQYYEEEGPEVFKGLRRLLPFTMSKMDWDLHVQTVVAAIRTNETN